MSNKGLTVMGVLAAVLAGAAVVMSNRPAPGIQGAGQPLYAGFEKRVNDTAIVTVSGGGETATIVRKDGGWGVQERGGYPADVSQVRALLIGMGGLTRVEPKTANDKLYGTIGVDDPSHKGSRAKLVVVKDAKGADIARLVVGDQTAGAADPTQHEYFVRKDGKKQSWLVTGNLVADAAPGHWLDTRLVAIDKKRIHKVTVQHGNGDRVVVVRDSPAAADFTLADLPGKAAVKSKFTVNDIADTMGRLTLADVHRAGDVAVADKPVFTATLETFDGLRLTLKGLAAKSDHKAKYVALSAAYDRDLVTPPPAGGKGRDQGKGKPQDQAGAALKPADVEKEAAALNAKVGPWVYELPAFELGNIDKTRADLVKADKPEKTAATPRAGKY